jgi:hypothetical protein
MLKITMDMVLDLALKNCRTKKDAEAMRLRVIKGGIKDMNVSINLKGVPVKAIKSVEVVEAQ